MAYVAAKRKRGVSQDRFSDKSVSSSRHPATKFREFHARRRGFLRFRSLVRRKKSTKPRDCCPNHEPILKSLEVIDEDSSIEQVSPVVEDDSSPLSVPNENIGNFLRVPLIRRSPRLKKKRFKVSHELFLPLKEEEEAEVKNSFSVRNRLKVLVLHKTSGIEIRGETLQCLKPCSWLNDDVINLYLELLKEREARDPQKYFKCHFFNTFFYVKLTRPSYNYKAVSRWTRHKRLGYNLIDCDIIFVPIHGGVHWTLAVINKRECKFMYLDSLNGSDPTVLTALAKYFVDEVKDKNGKTIDVSSWDVEYVKDLPLQQNGYDCGMFMLKYIDFYSRGLGLQFSQRNVPYFRLRTAKEILRLQAD